MPGIADLLDSDMEGNNDYLNENSLLSTASESEAKVQNKAKADSSSKPRKRHRVTVTKSKSRVAKSSPAATTKRVNKKTLEAKRKAIADQADSEAPHDDHDGSGQEQDDAQPRPRARPKASNNKKAVPMEATDVMDIEEASSMAQSSHAQGKPKTSAPKVSKASKPVSERKSGPTVTRKRQPETTDVRSDIDETPEAMAKQPPAHNPGREQYPRGRAGSASDTERGDPNLRRRLGDITRKFENVDIKYRNLKETGVNEANANVEKLRKQCETITETSSNLIASLKKELALQAPLAQDARKLRKEMQVQETEMKLLKDRNTDVSAALTAAQNEIKALQAKLAVARTTPAPTESNAGKVPGSAMKGMAANRIASGAANEASQLTQMKLDLYGDLTGLIVRSVKKAEDGNTYDCIQTGRNGTLHFKLFIDHEDAKSASFEETEFLYTPLLDADRDQAMIELMPAYLAEDITFERQNAAKFYQRVVDTLTRRLADG